MTVAVWIPTERFRSPGPGQELRDRLLGSGFTGQAAVAGIEQGLSTRVLDDLLSLAPNVGQSLTNLLKISDRTLARRRREGQLNSIESDRLYRLIDLYADAVEVLDGIEAADEWLRSPAVALGDRTPLEYSVNEAGTQRVKALLTRIAHGVYS
jgi:putative toxin-antitoxin system antitoxin component (TIGR02293 family)